MLPSEYDFTIQESFREGVKTRSNYIKGDVATQECISIEWGETETFWIYGDVKNFRESFELGCGYTKHN